MEIRAEAVEGGGWEVGSQDGRCSCSLLSEEGGAREAQRAPTHLFNLQQLLGVCSMQTAEDRSHPLLVDIPSFHGVFSRIWGSRC